MSSGILLLARAGGGAVETPFRMGRLGQDDPFAAAREIAWTGPDAISAGRCRFAGVSEIAAFPHTEAVVVVSGRLRLSQPGGETLVLAAGEGGVIAHGTALSVDAGAGAQWVFCAVTGKTSATPGLTRLAADAPLAPSAAPGAELLVGPTPQCRSFNAFTDEATRFRAGTWDSTPYRRISRPHRVNELMHLVSGSVELTGADGGVTRVETGDSVFVAHGADCAWDGNEPVAKFYVVQEVVG